MSVRLVRSSTGLSSHQPKDYEPFARMPATGAGKVAGRSTASHADEIVGESPLLRAALARVEAVADTDSTVLLLGETGTGKELFARAIHQRGPRRDRPLIRVNCAALPASLIESELFGHERGAFTGAVATRQGRFELADKGTLFLDEIGDLPLDVQATLLRVLEEGEFERVGSSHTRRVDVRVVAATHRDLEAAVEAGRFREDLYYRLSVFLISLPPLRLRREDIPRLVWAFIERRQRMLKRRIERIEPAVMKALQEHTWPGNVRELDNVIERALIRSRGNSLELDENLGARRPRGHPGGSSDARSDRTAPHRRDPATMRLAHQRRRQRRRHAWTESEHAAVPHAEARHHARSVADGRAADDRRARRAHIFRQRVTLRARHARVPHHAFRRCDRPRARSRRASARSRRHRPHRKQAPLTHARWPTRSTTRPRPSR